MKEPKLDTPNNGENIFGTRRVFLKGASAVMFGLAVTPIVEFTVKSLPETGETLATSINGSSRFSLRDVLKRLNPFNPSEKPANETVTSAERDPKTQLENFINKHISTAHAETCPNCKNPSSEPLPCDKQPNVGYIDAGAFLYEDKNSDGFLNGPEEITSSIVGRKVRIKVFDKVIVPEEKLDNSKRTPLDLVDYNNPALVAMEIVKGDTGWGTKRIKPGTASDPFDGDNVEARGSSYVTDPITGVSGIRFVETGSSQIWSPGIDQATGLYSDRLMSVVVQLEVLDSKDQIRVNPDGKPWIHRIVLHICPPACYTPEGVQIYSAQLDADYRRQLLINNQPDDRPDNSRLVKPVQGNYNHLNN